MYGAVHLRGTAVPALSGAQPCLPKAPGGSALSPGPCRMPGAPGEYVRQFPGASRNGPAPRPGGRAWTRTRKFLGENSQDPHTEISRRKFPQTGSKPEPHPNSCNVPGTTVPGTEVQYV